MKNGHTGSSNAESIPMAPAAPSRMAYNQWRYGPLLEMLHEPPTDTGLQLEHPLDQYNKEDENFFA